MDIINYYIEAFQKYADFGGRTNRTAFWYFFLVNILILFILGLFSKTLVFIYSLITLIPYLSVTVRRLRDTGFSVWHVLWLLILPIVTWILCILPSKAKSHR